MYSRTTLFVAITSCQIICCRSSSSHKIVSAEITAAGLNSPATRSSAGFVMREIQTGLHKPEGATKQRLTKSIDNSAPVCFPNCASICLGFRVSFDLPLALQNFGPVFTAPTFNTYVVIVTRGKARRGQALRLIDHERADCGMAVVRWICEEPRPHLRETCHSHSQPERRLHRGLAPSGNGAQPPGESVRSREPSRPFRDPRSLAGTAASMAGSTPRALNARLIAVRTPGPTSGQAGLALQSNRHSLGPRSRFSWFEVFLCPYFD